MQNDHIIYNQEPMATSLQKNSNDLIDQKNNERLIELIKNDNAEELATWFKSGYVPLTLTIDGEQLTSSQFACYQNQRAVQKVILEYRPHEINQPDAEQDGRTCLHIACEADEPNIKLIKLLLTKANVNAVTTKKKQTPLMLACLNPNITIEVLEVLSQTKGIDLYEQDRDGNTCLHLLAKNQAVTSDMYAVVLKQEQTLTQLNDTKSESFSLISIKNNSQQDAFYLLCTREPLLYDVMLSHPLIFTP